MSMLNPVKPPKLSEINLGSEVEVRDVMGGVQPFTGTVVGRTDSFGPSRIPAIHVKVNGGEVVVVSDTGKWQVRVNVDSAILGVTNDPAGLVHIRNKPTTKRAVQFLGGADSAVSIIRWAAGNAAISWRQGTADTAEALIVDTLEGQMEARVGDWVVCGLKGEFYPVKPDVFVEQYDVVDASQASPAVNLRDQVTAAQRERDTIAAEARAALLQGQQGQQGQQG